MKTFFLIIILILILSDYVKASELNLNIKGEHISNPTKKEKGYGLNTLFAELEYRNNGFIFAAAIGLHDESIDCPEFCTGSNELARVTVGYSFIIW